MIGNLVDILWHIYFYFDFWFLQRPLSHSKSPYINLETIETSARNSRYRFYKVDLRKYWGSNSNDMASELESQVQTQRRLNI